MHCTRPTMPPYKSSGDINNKLKLTLLCHSSVVDEQLPLRLERENGEARSGSGGEHGEYNISISSADRLITLKKIAEAKFGIECAQQILVHRDHILEAELRQLNQCGLRHGSLVHIFDKRDVSDTLPTTTTTTKCSRKSYSITKANIINDEEDDHDQAEYGIYQDLSLESPMAVELAAERPTRNNCRRSSRKKTSPNAYSGDNKNNSPCISVSSDESGCSLRSNSNDCAFDRVNNCRSRLFYSSCRGQGGGGGDGRYGRGALAHQEARPFIEHTITTMSRSTKLNAPAVGQNSQLETIVDDLETMATAASTANGTWSRRSGLQRNERQQQQQQNYSKYY
jgi:hypothetical protein